MRYLAILTVLLLAGCASYNRQTEVALSEDGSVQSYTETVQAGGLFNSASLENARSSTSLTNGHYQATKGLDAAQSSGNAELLKELGGFTSQVIEGALNGANPSP